MNAFIWYENMCIKHKQSWVGYYSVNSCHICAWNIRIHSSHTIYPHIRVSKHASMTGERCCDCNPKNGCNCKTKKCKCKGNGRACINCICGPDVCKNWISHSKQSKLRFTKDSVHERKKKSVRQIDEGEDELNEESELRREGTTRDRSKAISEEMQSEAEEIPNIAEDISDEIVGEEELQELQRRVLGMVTEPAMISGCVWRERWLRIVQFIRTTRVYSPSGPVGRELCKLLAQEVQKCTEDPHSPDSRCIVFMSIMLQKVARKSTAREYKEIIGNRLTIRERGEIWASNRWITKRRKEAKEERV